MKYLSCLSITWYILEYLGNSFLTASLGKKCIHTYVVRRDVQYLLKRLVNVDLLILILKASTIGVHISPIVIYDQARNNER